MCVRRPGDRPGGGLGRLLIVALLALLAGWPAAAQEQRGALEGVIKDSLGGVLPGVTVEAKNLEVGNTVTAVTDGAGVFRFPALPPGLYDIKANLDGFAPAAVPQVVIELGQVKKVDVTLSVGGVTESVQVSGEAPLVDTKQSGRASAVRSDQIDMLPRGRDFSTLIAQTPGASNESRLGGISIDGSSAGENRFIVDGVETTNLVNGTQGSGVPAEFLEEMNVRSSGFAAEYGGATGGVINVLTRSGTNQLRGRGIFNFTSEALTGKARPTLRLNPADADVAEHVTYSKDAFRQLEPGLLVGGPIVKDRAWFFAGYQPLMVDTDRTVRAEEDGSLVSRTQKVRQHNFTANQTAQIRNSIRTRLAFNNSWSRQDGNLPALNGSDAVGANYDVSSTFPNWSLSANVDWVARPNLYFGFRTGYYFSDNYTRGVEDKVHYYFWNTTNINYLDVPASLQRVANYNSMTSNDASDWDRRTRIYAQADTTWYMNLAGRHTLKTGVQLDYVGNDVFQRETRPWVRILWDRALGGRRGQYGYYRVRTNPLNPEWGFVTNGAVSTTILGLFVQDDWAIGNRLTLNLGVRSEMEKVPAFAEGPGIPDYAIEFPFGDKVGPRAGFAWDIAGDGKWAATGSWGVFYDIFKLQLARGSFGGDKWWEYYYTLDTYDWPNLVASAGCPPACPGTLLRGPVDFRHPSLSEDELEQNLKPMRTQQWALGLERQLGGTMALSLRYVHRQLDRAVEDTGSLDEHFNEIYIIANPSEGKTRWAFEGVPLPKPKRDYDSLQVAWNRRMSDNWFMRASYTWSRLWGNYTGLSQGDEEGRTDPNVGRSYDYPLMMFTQAGEAAYGALPTDRPHQLRLSGGYRLPFGTTIGANYFIQSGVPVTRQATVIPGSDYAVQYLGRGSDGRTEVESQVDLNLSHQFRLGRQRLQLGLNVQNLFDQMAGNNRFATQTAGGAGGSLDFDEADFYAGKVDFQGAIDSQGVALDPRFLKYSGYQAPRFARLTLSLLF